ncbi:MAG: hypothetical protein UY72_C0009G0007 [Candidatus Uhrbacteria bacterium GW2011_GWD2_52_7]|uniref:Uncharacterized protein n=1 Tax=Candidatus Uhrbacteria bacterium GW2011_GWD2_52_7 TaxID=1618989 RepID=A0A0G2ADL7_9BACT|nr:MAG: hypothetical protein UY72_C0009G0007 [Candidatus Uhrbacteria bacterium GW2011_GWD2_52_7]
MSLIDIINSSPLADDQKTALVERVEAEGATPDVVADVRAALQEYIDGGFQTLGVEVDVNDPAVKAATEKMEQEIAAAEADFNDSMADIDAEAKAVQQAIVKDADKIQANMIKGQI